jgi:hypothetical protein
VIEVQEQQPAWPTPRTPRGLNRPTNPALSRANARHAAVRAFRKRARKCAFNLTPLAHYPTEHIVIHESTAKEVRACASSMRA